MNYSVDRKSNNYTQPSGAHINRTYKMKRIHNNNATETNDVLRANHNNDKHLKLKDNSRDNTNRLDRQKKT